jgi:2-alkyl-3-oxoalkanoate reductase
MKIFLAGATGAVGKRLLPMLVASGHQVTATTTTAAKMTNVKAAGATDAVVLDGLDRDAVMRAVAAARPEVIIHQMTSLSSMRSLKRFDEEFALSNRLRTEGTRHLVEAARAAGVRRIVAQSYTGWNNIREGGRVKTEDDPLDPSPAHGTEQTLDAMRQLEAMVTGATDLSGVILRYGSFYGPGTSLAPGGDIFTSVRKRQLPIVGDGAGVWSFLHIDDAARAALIASEHGPDGIFNIVDDEPVDASVWLPELARLLGAKPPRHVPVWLGRLFIGDPGVSMMTRIRGSSNAKARRVLNWEPAYPSWREGFRQVLRAAA